VLSPRKYVVDEGVPVALIPPTGSPVALVKTAADGVPKAGVTKVGDVLKTAEPEPVVVVTPVPPPAGCNTPEEFICELSIATLFACVIYLAPFLKLSVLPVGL
jgi:hypothetical protein